MSYYDDNFDTDFTDIEASLIVFGVFIGLVIIVLCAIAC